MVSAPSNVNDCSCSANLQFYGKPRARRRSADRRGLEANLHSLESFSDTRGLIGAGHRSFTLIALDDLTIG